MKQLVLGSWALGCLLALGSPVARGEIITFDDLSDSGGGTLISTTYKGLSWTNFYVLNTSSYGTPSGYLNAVVSKDNVAFNGFGAPAVITSPTAFDLKGGWFTAAWNNGLTVQVTGYFNKQQVGQRTFSVDTTGPTFESLDLDGVDMVVFTSSGGTPAMASGNGTHFALDDLEINADAAQLESAPEPSTLILFGMGALGAGIVGLRRTRK